MNVFRANGIHKRFGSSMVHHGLDLELAPGQVTVLLGPNGSGKSTLLRLAIGQLERDAGELEVLGVDPARSRDLQQSIGFVPDVPDAYPWMTIGELLRFCAPHYPTWDRDYAAEFVEQLRVPLAVPLRGLSRGQGMKAMLVAALAHRPPLLLLDEPFAGLDPIVREDVLRGVIGSIRDGERTVLCTTHDLDAAARIADRIATLEDGRITAHGPVGEFVAEGAGAIEQLRGALARPMEVLS